MSPLLAAGVVCLCLVGSFIFSGVETGLLALNRIRLRTLARKKNRRAMILTKYLQKPERFLAASLIGNTILNTIAVTLVAYWLIQWNERAGGWIAFVLMSCVLYVVCELAAKSLFRQFPTRLTVAMADVLRFLYGGLIPVVWLFSSVTSVLLRAFGGRGPREEIYVSREELQRLVLDREAGGQFTADERRMIQEVFNLRQITLRQIMTPMKQVATVPVAATAPQIVDISRQSSCSRLPVLDGVGNVTGVVSVYDILFDPEPTEQKTAQDYIRRAHALAADISIDQALQRLRATQQPLAVVVDKNQRPAGIVTMEDMLAKLIGEVEG